MVRQYETFRAVENAKADAPYHCVMPVAKTMILIVNLQCSPAPSPSPTGFGFDRRADRNCRN